jgi:hypothetical protein
VVRSTLLIAGLILTTAATACSADTPPPLPPPTSTSSAPSTPASTSSASVPSSTPSAADPDDPFRQQFATDPRTPVTWLVKPTGVTETDAALATYRHLVFAVARVFSAPDPADSELLQLTSGQARRFFTDQLVRARQSKSAQLGPTVVKSATTKSTGNDIAVSACHDLTRSYVYVDGKRSANAAGFYRETVVLHKEAGGWKVIQLNGEQGKPC